MHVVDDFDTDDLEPDDDVDTDDESGSDEHPLPQPSDHSGGRRRRQRTGSRPKVLARRELKAAVAADRPFVDVLDEERPKTRGECRGGERPCPWVGCKYHLYLSVNPENGSIVLTFPDHEPWELKHTCALDVADAGPITLEEVGAITNLTRERIRQVESKGLIQLRLSPRFRGVKD